MESSRSKRRRLMMSSYISSRRPDFPATFESLNDDTKRLILKFVGNKSYATYARINKHCKEIYLTTEGMTKETFLFGYGSLSVIQDRIGTGWFFNWKVQIAMSKGVVFYNRGDVFCRALEGKDNPLLRGICYVAAGEGRIDLLNKVWDDIDDENEYGKSCIFESLEMSAEMYNCIEDGDDKESIVVGVETNAARHGKLDVLKWFWNKGLFLDKRRCAEEAAEHGHLHIIQWLKEEEILQLDGELYGYAIDGNQLYVMKWLREKACPWDNYNFPEAAETGNLDILQWLQDEGCYWPTDDEFRVYEEDLKSEVIDWCRVNGYRNRIEFT